MHRRVLIFNGMLSEGSYFEGGDPRNWFPGVEFPLFHADDGKPVKGDYRGDAWVGRGDDGRYYVNINRGLEVESLVVAPQPTIESARFDAGWRHAMKQKRRGKPGQNWDGDFWRGWMDAWQKRKEAGV